MKKQILHSALFVMISIYSYGQSNSVEIWIRAFIPDPQNAGGGVGYINPVPSGGSSVSLHNINPSIPNICFATDNRGFSDDPSVTSRLETKFTITLNNDGTAKVTPSQNRTNAAVTKKVDCTTGTIVEQKSGSVDRDNIGTPAVADGVVQVIGQVQGRNLLTPLGSIGPSIDYSFDIQWKPSTSTLTASVTIGSFPAFEIYARQPNGKWIKIFQQVPKGAPWQLGADAFGINSSRITETKTVAGITGKWQSPAPEQRFTLEFQGKKIKWAEKNQSGAALIKDVDVIELADGKFKIERPNNDEVLAFLGFQPSLRAEILARNPQPSFIILYRNGDKITAEWNGLIAIKDANAHLRDLVQPGVRPAKIFELSQPL
jgi:hypothetical protein